MQINNRTNSLFLESGKNKYTGFWNSIATNPSSFYIQHLPFLPFFFSTLSFTRIETLSCSFPRADYTLHEHRYRFYPNATVWPPSHPLYLDSTRVFSAVAFLPKPFSPSPLIHQENYSSREFGASVRNVHVRQKEFRELNFSMPTTAQLAGMTNTWTVFSRSKCFSFFLFFLAFVFLFLFFFFFL